MPVTRIVQGLLFTRLTGVSESSHGQHVAAVTREPAGANVHSTVLSHGAGALEAGVSAHSFQTDPDCAARTPVKINAKNETFVNDSEADRLRTREYSEGFVVPKKI